MNVLVALSITGTHFKATGDHSTQRMSSDLQQDCEQEGHQPEEMVLEDLLEEYKQLLEQKKALEMRVHKSEERRRALMHILSDLNTVNRKLNDQRKAMIHILADYEQDRRRLARQTERLDNSRRALMHILQDSHQSNLRLENSRKAMIHIMSDRGGTTARAGVTREAGTTCASR